MPSIKKTLLLGTALALPFGVVLYVALKFFKLFQVVMLPIAKRFGFTGLPGEILLVVLAGLLMLLLAFLFGLLMQFSIVNQFRVSIEEKILKLFPSLTHLKLLADEKLQTGDSFNDLKAVLLENHVGVIVIAYLIEETEEFITYAKVKSPSMEAGEVTILRKNNTRYTEISMTELRLCNKQLGKGYIDILERSNMAQK
jgi:uncharacterized membrane protein